METLQHVLPPVAAMVQLQLLTGMRPGEVTIMRAADLDMTGKVWLYRPSLHKTMHHGHERVIVLGPRAQEIRPAFFEAGYAGLLVLAQGCDGYVSGNATREPQNQGATKSEEPAKTQA